MRAVGRVVCEAGGARLSGQHDRLLAASANRSVFLTADFVEPWFEVFGSQHELVNLTVSVDGELVGAAPWAIQPGTVGQPLRRLVPAGQSPTSGEYLDVVAVEGSERLVAEALADELTGPLRRRWDVLVAQRVLADGLGMAELARALAARGYPAELVPTGLSPFTTLPGPGGDLLAGRSKNFRDQVKQARSRVARLGSVRLRTIGVDLGLDEGLEQLLELHRARWAEESSFDSPDKIRFHRAVARRLHARQGLYLAVLEVEGKPAAARYDFVHDDKMWCVQGGWNPAFAAARPGLHMTDVAMTWAMTRGLREYDFLGGEGDYKQRWSTGSRDLVTVVVRNPATMRGRAMPWVKQGRRSLDRLVVAARSRKPGEGSPESKGDQREA